jgi:hypothetical protein
MNRRQMLKLGLYSGLAAGADLLPKRALAQYGYPSSTPPCITATTWSMKTTT